MEDQLQKAQKGDHSIFSRDPKKNLISKNLSWEEIKTILLCFNPTQYDDVIMVYHDVYKYASKIADNDERNAKRHIYWMVSLARAFGTRLAEKLGDAHERGRPGTDEDNCMDRKVNAAALKYAFEENNLHKSASDIADEMWESGLVNFDCSEVATNHTVDEYSNYYCD